MKKDKPICVLTLTKLVMQCVIFMLPYTEEKPLLDLVTKAGATLLLVTFVQASNFWG